MMHTVHKMPPTYEEFKDSLEWVNNRIELHCVTYTIGCGKSEPFMLVQYGPAFDSYIKRLIEEEGCWTEIRDESNNFFCVCKTKYLVRPRPKTGRGWAYQIEESTPAQGLVVLIIYAVLAAIIITAVKHGV